MSYNNYRQIVFRTFLEGRAVLPYFTPSYCSGPCTLDAQEIFVEYCDSCEPEINSKKLKIAKHNKNVSRDALPYFLVFVAREWLLTIIETIIYCLWIYLFS